MLWQRPVELLYSSPAVVVVNKPAQVAVHRGWADDRAPMLQRVRDAIGAHVYAAHRLDRATSGALVFARAPEHAAALAAAFREGAVDKRYLAFTRGATPPSGRIDHPVPKDKSKRSLRVPAVTEFERRCVVIGGPEERAFSLVAVRPLTGRLHQIRRHFKHLSHPLVGDVRYGKGEINRWFRDTCGLSRLALHARGVAFVDPATGARVQVLAPVPEDLAGPLSAFGVPPSALGWDPFA